MSFRDQTSDFYVLTIFTFAYNSTANPPKSHHVITRFWKENFPLTYLQRFRKFSDSKWWFFSDPLLFHWFRLFFYACFETYFYYFQSLSAPLDDPRLQKEFYERNWEQNEELGLNDMKVENYGELDAVTEEKEEDEQSWLSGWFRVFICYHFDC